MKVSACLVSLLLLSVGHYVEAQIRSDDVSASRDGELEQAKPQIMSSPAILAPANEAAADEPLLRPVDGDFAPLAVWEQGRASYLRGGVMIRSVYDDHALSLTGEQSAGFSYSFMPYIEFVESTSRLDWNLKYSAGLIADQRISDENVPAQNFGGEIEYRPGSHLKVGISEQFILTNGRNVPPAAFPEKGEFKDPNPSVIAPISRQFSNSATAQLSYQYSSRDVVGGGVRFFDHNFIDALATTSSFADTGSQSVFGFYNHRLSPRQWVGLSYQFQAQEFDPSDDRSRTHSFLLYDRIRLRRKMTLSVFAGPEHSAIDTHLVTQISSPPFVLTLAIPVSRLVWSGSAGVNFSWQGERTSLNLGAGRRVSEGGGLLGAVELTSAEAGLRRRLTRASNLALGAVFGDNRDLGKFAYSSPSRLRSGGTSLEIEYKLKTGIMLNLGYAREWQRPSRDVPPPSELNYNRSWVSLACSFDKPVGR